MGSAVLLFGSALVYGSTGELGFSQIAEATSAGGLADDPILLVGLAMILAGLAFKASAAPFHMWTPDVYEGAPTPVTGFMAAATKTVALVLTYRLLDGGVPREGGRLDDRGRRPRLHLARLGQPRGARPAARQAAPGLLVDLARRLHADRDRRRQRARRARAPLLPDPLLRDLGRRLRDRRRP